MITFPIKATPNCDSIVKIFGGAPPGFCSQHGYVLFVLIGVKFISNSPKAKKSIMLNSNSTNYREQAPFLPTTHLQFVQKVDVLIRHFFIASSNNNWLLLSVL